MARKLLQEDQFIPVKETDLQLSFKPDVEAVYHLRPLTSNKAREIANAHTAHVFSRRTHKQEDVPDVKAINEATLDYVIAKWDGVTNGTGAAAPCDLEHKIKLPIDLQVALIDRAQIGDDAEQQAASFRRPA